MDKTWLEHRMNITHDLLGRKLDELHDIPVGDLDAEEVDMIHHIYEAFHYICEIKQKMQ